MSETSRSISGTIDIPLPTCGVICMQCRAELPYEHENCWACGAPVADSFRGNTEVTTDPGLMVEVTPRPSVVVAYPARPAHNRPAWSPGFEEEPVTQVIYVGAQGY